MDAIIYEKANPKTPESILKSKLREEIRNRKSLLANKVKKWAVMFYPADAAVRVLFICRALWRCFLLLVIFWVRFPHHYSPSFRSLFRIFDSRLMILCSRERISDGRRLCILFIYMFLQSHIPPHSRNGLRCSRAIRF